MANEKWLIDAKKALYLAEHSGLYDFDLDALETLLFDEPCITVDAVEVVRCKDCKRFIPFCEPYNKAGQCRKMVGLINENDFCSYGERIEDNENL